jgi:hypothetical protein
MVLLVYEETRSLLHGHVELGRLAFARLGTMTLLSVVVVLASFPGQKLPAFGDFDALAIRLVGFDGHGITGVYTTDLSFLCPVFGV